VPSAPRSAYNVFDEPEVTKEQFTLIKRTKTEGYDAAGRLTSSTTTSPLETALPSVTDEYSSATGALEKQSTTSGGKTRTITSVTNKLGQLESYTDAAENKTTYEYNINGAVKKGSDGEGTETFTYNEATGVLSELLYENELSKENTTKLLFTAAYDPEGNRVKESYPNGMTASYTYNQVGKPTALEYEKTTHCTSKCVWFSDSVVPSIHGQWLEQASTLSHQAYTYDAAGRLTEVENTPAGQDCTARIYSYDEDSNRVSLTTRESSTSKCATEGGQVQGYLYDTGDRLDEPGTSYNVFDDITALPAQGSEDPELTSTYFTDNQVASQKQNKQTLSYVLDPAERTLEVDATGEPINANVLSHYAGPGNTPAWTSNTSTKAWKRNITGIDGSLVATQNNGETPVLELSNLHGDIIATASASETATELASKADTSEFGVPTVPNPEKYAWLGAVGLPTELPSGLVTMGGRSYVPQLGRFLQPDPIPGGSANAYSYTFGDPVNSSDPTGDYAATAGSGAVLIWAAEAAAAARAAAEYAARVALEDAANAAGP
jgi:RHS repeat-associated protein